MTELSCDLDAKRRLSMKSFPITVFVISIAASTLQLFASPTTVKQSDDASQRAVWAAAWDNPKVSLRFVFPMVWLRWPIDAPVDKYQGFFPSTPIPQEALIRDALLRIPEGRRALFAWHFGKGIFGLPFDSVQLPNGDRLDQPSPWCRAAIAGAAGATGEWTTFINALRNAQVKLDLLVLDNEQAGIFNNFNLLEKDPSGKNFTALIEDPRANQRLFGIPPLKELVQTVALNRLQGPQQSSDYLLWNYALGKLTAAAMNEALWIPAKSAYPNLKASNYEGFQMNPEDASPDRNGHSQPYDNIFGNGNSPICYGVLGQSATAWGINPNDPTRLVLGGSNKLNRGPWSSLVMDVQTIRSVRRSSTSDLFPWISTPAYIGGEPGDQLSSPLCGYPEDKRYYEEMIRHLVLTGSKIFLVWNPPSKSDTQRIAHAQELDTILTEMNTKLGGFVSAPLSISRVPFDGNVIVSGARGIDGKYWWRVSVAPGIRSVTLRGTTTEILIPSDVVGVWYSSTTAVVPEFETHSTP